MSYCKDAYIDSLEKKLHELEKEIVVLKGRCWFCNDNGLVSMKTEYKDPYIKVVDRDRDTQYTILITYCPICGRRL